MPLLSQSIRLSGLTKKQFIELFDISQRTYERWEKNTPRRILNILSRLRHNSPAWENWTFDRHFIVDPAGNAYTQTDVMNIFWTRQLTDTLTGKPSNVRSLKSHLETKIKQNNITSVSICLNNGPDALKQFNINL